MTKLGSRATVSVLAVTIVFLLGAAAKSRPADRPKPVKSPELEAALSSALQQAREKDKRVLVLFTSNGYGLGPVALVEGVLSDTEVQEAFAKEQVFVICRVTDHLGPTHLAWKALYAEFSGKGEDQGQLFPALAVLTADRKCVSMTVPDNDGRSTVEKVKAHVLKFLADNAPPREKEKKAGKGASAGSQNGAAEDAR